MTRNADLQLFNLLSVFLLLRQEPFVVLPLEARGGFLHHQGASFLRGLHLEQNTPHCSVHSPTATGVQNMQIDWNSLLR